MITVKLFGLLRLNSGIKERSMDVTGMHDVFRMLLSESDLITKKELEGCVILINGKPGTKRSKLKDGDEVTLLSPVAGG